MAVKPALQMKMGEPWLEDPEFEVLLDERERAREAVSQARKVFAGLDERAKGRVLELEIPEDGTVRCGRFVIVKKEIVGRTVTFDTKAAVRVTIRLAKEE